MKKNFRIFFVREVFFMKFFFIEFFSTNFFLVKIFFIEFFLANVFSFHKNIFANIFFTIFSRISFVFDVGGIMYFTKFFIRNFAYCEFFCFAILVYGKIIVNFCDFFLGMNVNTKFENVSFLKKSKIFSARTFEFLYSLLGKKQCFAMNSAQEKSKST